MPMTSKDLLEKTRAKHTSAMAAALKSGDPEQMNTAMAAYFNDVHDAILREAADAAEVRNQDNSILAARGVTVLTSTELSYYSNLSAAMRAENPRLALENFDVAMPETIIERVIETIRRAHPLLDAIDFRSTAYMTRVILNAAPAKAAVWGKITAAITEEITGSLKEFSLAQCKLTAFMCISQDLLELGPQWLDRYVVATLSEAIALGAETGIVDGDGKDCPVGMTRVIPEEDVSTGVTYARKEAIAVADMSPQTWGPLVAELCKDPLDDTKARTVDGRDLILVCNPFDYWAKIMPATSFRKPDGEYVRDILPVPATLFQTSALEQGKAVLGIGPNYVLALGPGGKKGFITPDDSVRFFEDERAYKAKLLGNGRPMDNNSFLYLDISDMLNYLATLVKDVSAGA